MYIPFISVYSYISSISGNSHTVYNGAFISIDRLKKVHFDLNTTSGLLLKASE